jgi:hypothetical protein
LRQIAIVLPFLEQAKLAPESDGVGRLEAASERAEGLVRDADGARLKAAGAQAAAVTSMGGHFCVGELLRYRHCPF